MREKHKERGGASNEVLANVSVIRFVRSARKPFLSAEETNALVQKAKAGDVCAQNELVTANLGLVIKMALRYSKRAHTAA